MTQLRRRLERLRSRRALAPEFAGVEEIRKLYFDGEIRCWAGAKQKDGQYWSWKPVDPVEYVDRWLALVTNRPDWIIRLDGSVLPFPHTPEYHYPSGTWREFWWKDTAARITPLIIPRKYLWDECFMAAVKRAGYEVEPS